MQETFPSADFRNHGEQEELKTTTMQICPKCGEPVGSYESFHECGKIARLLIKSVDREGNTSYPDLQKIFNESQRIWITNRERAANPNRDSEELTLELDQAEIDQLEQLNEQEAEFPEMRLEEGVTGDYSMRPRREGFDLSNKSKKEAPKD